MNSRRAKALRHLDGKVSIDPRKNADVRHLLGPAGILDDKAVEFGIRLVRRTGLVERYQPLLTHTLGKDRSRITVEGFLVGMTLLSCVLRRPPELTEAATVLFEMVPVKWDGRFQRKESEPFRRTTNRKPPTEKERLAFYAAVRRLWGQFSLTMDAFPYPKDRRLTLDEVKELPRLPADEAARRDANLDEVCNILLGATVELAREILPIDSWEMLHAVDATVMEANARPPTKELASAEVEGTVYMRSVPITPTRTSTKTGKPIKRRDTPRTTKEKVEWGYEVTIDSTAPNPRNEYRDLPEFAVSMTIHGCGADPAGNGEKVLRAAQENGLPPGLVAFDSAYVKLPFLAAARELGAEVLFDPLATQIPWPSAATNDENPTTVGRPSGLFTFQAGNVKMHLGAKIHAGGPLCPGIEPALLTIEDDYNLHRIDADERDELIAERERYRMWRKDVLPNGKERWVCPALAANERDPRLACSRRPDSLKVEGLQIVPKPPKANPDPEVEQFNVCTAKSVTIDPGDYLLEWQAYAHHGPEWRMYFAALRNGVERDNSQVKSGAGQALAVADRRYLRGRANNGLMAAWMLMGHNVDLLRSWLRKAMQDKDGVLVEAPLKNRRGDRRPEHARAAWAAAKGARGSVKGARGSVKGSAQPAVADAAAVDAGPDPPDTS